MKQQLQKINKVSQLRKKMVSDTPVIIVAKYKISKNEEIQKLLDRMYKKNLCWVISGIV